MPQDATRFKMITTGKELRRSYVTADYNDATINRLVTAPRQE